MSLCPHSYPQMWTGQPSWVGSLPSVVGEAHPSCLRALDDPTSLLGGLWPVPVGKALPEANSFISECQPFCNIVRECSAGTGGRAGAGLTQRTDVSTLEQSPERWRNGCESDIPRNGGCTRRYEQDAELTNGCRGCPRAAAAARCNEERQPWPRASGPSSRTIGVVRACTASGCGCAPARDARSSPGGVARDASR